MSQDKPSIKEYKHAVMRLFRDLYPLPTPGQWEEFAEALWLAHQSGTDVTLNIDTFVDSYLESGEPSDWPFIS